MKVVKCKHIKAKSDVAVIDCYVDKGYLKMAHGSLPDVDQDFQSDKRQEVKEYYERRYNHDGKQRVFSAGTFTTLKVKAVIKDVARTMRISPSLVNYLTAIFEDDKMDYTGVFELAAQNKKVAKFIHDYPMLFEDIRTLMFQPRSSSIHASALLVTPDEMDGEDMECFDYVPIKKVDGILVSEDDGYSLDELGLLKNDCLATKELSKLHETIDLVNENYGTNITMEEIVRGNMDDPKVYELLRQGFTQNVFQFSSIGMTKFLVSMKPSNINDLIAANALFRPATLDSGSTDVYVNCKTGLVAPVYLWGTYNAMKDTFGVLCIAENSPVSTLCGDKAIQNIVAGDMVLTEDGSYHKVLANIDKGRNSVVRVHTDFGEDLVCTPDHQVLTGRGWVKASDLQPNNDVIKAFWTENECLEDGTLQDWCLGIYLANGNYTCTCNISCRNQNEANVIAEKFNKAFVGLNAYVYFHTRCWYVMLSAESNQGVAYKKPNSFKEYIKAIGLEGKTCYDKSITIPISKALLAGFIEGDGCTLNNTIRLCNQQLAYQLYKGFQACRIPSSYYERLENGVKVYCVKFNDNRTRKLKYVFKQHHSTGQGFYMPSQYLSSIDLTLVDNVSRKNIRKSIRKRNICKQNTLDKYNGCWEHEMWAKVITVEDESSTQLYDLSVDTNHSFCVGGLVVHNCYQEQLAQISREVGGLSLAEGVKLVKFISKKKQDKIDSMKSKFMEGAAAKGCPAEDAVEIWKMFEVAGGYCFNKSHSTAYAATAYVGAWLKANYPTAFYTIALQWADDKELLPIMSEMTACSEAKVVAPDINKSGMSFYTDYATNSIFWSLSRIKMLGAKAVEWIINEREKNGEFTSVVNFIERVFKYKLKKYQYWDDPDNEDEAVRCPVNARHVLNLILAGCFDNVEHAGSVVERYAILEKAAETLGFEIKPEDFPAELIGKHYFWSQKQIKVSGLGAIDYKRIYDNSDIKPSIKGRATYRELKDIIKPELDGTKAAVCATIVEMEEKKFTSKKTGEQEVFCKVTLQQNNDMTSLIIWPTEYKNARALLLNNKNKIIICMAGIKYSDYSGKNELQLTRNNLIEVI